MRCIYATAAIIAVLVAGVGCGKGDDTSATPKKDGAVLETRMERLTQSLTHADSTLALDKPVARWLLPPDLSEISGLALTPDGRLFAHNDENARITEIDYRRGTITKHFFVGENVRGDFEGIVYAQDRFILLSSDGNLYEFPEGGEGEKVGYKEHDTKLGKECEFEGLTYDTSANAIVLACKNVNIKKFKQVLVLYRYHLDTGETSELTVPYSEVIGKNHWKQLRPTDITVDPSNGNFVMVDAQEKALVVLTPAGKVVLSRPLDGKHAQPEGIAITKDHILMISDESNKTAATLTLYRWP